MELKTYQKNTLNALKKFLSEAKGIGNSAAFKKYQNAPNYSSEYFSPEGLEDAPYICLRLPTGGGKTLLGACSIGVATQTFLEREYPLVLWLVPTDVIRQQTLKALRNVETYYWQVLSSEFQGAINIFDITEFRRLRPQDLRQSLNIFVATFQSLRVNDASRDKYKVYQSNEYLEPCFRNIPKEDYFEVNEQGRYSSFGNLVAYLRPLIIIDEAHNYSTELSLEVMQKLRPSAVIRLTATPAKKNSNVLYQVSAEELRAEGMIKLPVELGESFSWELAIDEAVQRRTALETLANREAEYIRPIALFQAESKNREITVDVVKKYLIDEAKIPENQIAIATGKQRELENVNLFSRDCQIRYVITVQALKEGWDCSFAYVFCSVAKVHSPKDAEQLFGRVLRMPFATLRNTPELNKAYAFVAVKEWRDAANQIYDNLINMGFEKSEAAAAIQLKCIDSLPTTIKIATNERPQLGTLGLSLQEKAAIKNIPSGYELVMENLNEEDWDELRKNAKIIYKDKEARKELSKAIGRSDFQPTHKNSPSDNGVEFKIPMLCLNFEDDVELAEPELFLPEGWKLTDNCDTELPNFRKDVETQTYEFDVKEQKVIEKYKGYGTANLFHGETNWSINELAGWLTDRVISDELFFEDLFEFTRRILKRLSEEKKVELDELVRLRFKLVNLLADKVNACLDAARGKYYEQTLFDKGNIACIKPDIAMIFRPGCYPAKSFYRGRVQFQKHFYPTIGNMNSEEIRCAQLIDANENVATWIRNIDSTPLPIMRRESP